MSRCLERSCHHYRQNMKHLGNPQQSHDIFELYIECLSLTTCARSVVGQRNLDNYTLLVSHITIKIIDARYPQEPQSKVDEQYKITTIHLSRYCMHLVIYSPELLLDDDQWCNTLYITIKKDNKCVLVDPRDGVLSNRPMEDLCRRQGAMPPPYLLGDCPPQVLATC